MKSSIPFLCILALAIFSSKAHGFTSTLTATNYEDGVTDIIFADSSGTPLVSGIATMGYFPDSYSVSTSLSISVLIDNFTVAASETIGSSVEWGPIPGYALPDLDFLGNFESVTVDGSALAGRPLYGFLGNGSTLSNSTQVALYQIAVIQPGAVYNLKRDGSAAILGTFGGITAPIDLGLGVGAVEYQTLNLVAVPEASTALLATIGCVGIFRRRRA